MVLKKSIIKPEIIKKETFAPIEEEKEQKKPIRYMYNTSGLKRNSSYDIRAEESNIPNEPEKTGKINHSNIDNNLTNQRLILN